MDITDYITNCVENNIPVTFLKYGDGEFNCVFYGYGTNCDNDTYTQNLQNGLLESFKFLVENVNNVYIGLWHNLETKSQWESLVSKNVNWVNYHTIIIDKKDDYQKLKLYKSIKYSTRKKIIVCNELLVKSKLLLNMDHVVIVPFNNWYDNKFNSILNEISEFINDDNNHIVITCCGMSAKVLICELNKKFPNGIYLDFGSSLDLICTKRESRGQHFNESSYEYISNFLCDILPENWNDSSFDYIYEESKKKLGIHLP